MFHLREEGHFTNCGRAAPSVGEGQPGVWPSPAADALLLDLRATRHLTLLRGGRGWPGRGARVPWRGQEI